MLVSLNDVLHQAYEEKYAVGAFNCYNYETIKGVIEAAAELDRPVIIAFGAKYLSNMDFSTVVKITQDLASKVNIPVVLHLDHCSDIDLIIQAIRAGFSSVMYDGSMLNFEENMANTKKVTEIAHAVGVSVEAELGSLSAGDQSHEGSLDDVETLTDPVAALEFVEKTNVDALAVSVGTVHGLYKGEPNIRINLLKEINEKIGAPLVLHGGSGVPEKDMIACIENGVTKVNVNTEISMNTVESIKNMLDETNPHFSVLSLEARSSVKEITKKYINFLGK